MATDSAQPGKWASFKLFVARAWTLTRPYYLESDEKWKARALLVAIIALNLGLVYMAVLFNDWNKLFYDALQDKKADVFWTQLGRFTYLAFAFIIIAVYKFYLTQLLEMRWRAWMTRHYLQRWLANQAFYHLELARFTRQPNVDKANPDNPDQRIQEDISQFTSATISVTMGLLNSVVTLLSFVGILWGLSGGFAFTFQGSQYNIPGFMVWMAVLYCAVGSVLTHYIGRPQIQLNFEQQRVEADFRHHMVRVREYSESIALDRGEAVERVQLEQRFGRVLDNTLRLIKAQKNLVWFTSFFGQAAVVFPFVVAAPRFFSGAIQLGELMQISSAFGQVQGALSWFVDSYSGLASWRATTDRLTSFEESFSALAMTERAQAATDSIALTAPDLTVTLPNGQVLLAGASCGPQRASTFCWPGPRAAANRPCFAPWPASGLLPWQRGAPAGRHVHPAAALLSERTAARRPRLPAAASRLHRRPAVSGAQGCTAAATERATRRGGRLGSKALRRRAAAPGDCPRAAQKAQMGVCRRGHQRAG
jgi:putative ATP-binding cassette transporter